MINGVLTYDEAQAIRDTILYEEDGVLKRRNDIIMPQEGFQEKVLSSPASFLIIGGNRGGGKSIALILSVIYDYDNPRFNARLFRREKDDFKRGMWQETDVFYEGLGATKRESDYTWVFQSGAELKFEQISNEAKADTRFRGGGVPRILMDEINQFSEETIWTLIKSNRNAYGIHNSLIGTTNPDVDSWVFPLLSWYLNEDGTTNEERSGKIRYFYKHGKTHKDIYWGNTREEVYRKAKPLIDKYFSEENSNLVSKMNMIKSFQFIHGSVYDNKILLSQDKEYISNIASGGEEVVNRELLGIWRKFEDEDELITSEVMESFLENDNQSRNDERWLTIDVATEGGDFFVAYVWNDWNIIDVEAINNIAANEILPNILRLARHYRIPNNRIIYDADGIGSFLGSKYNDKGFIKNAVAFHGNDRPKNRNVFFNLNAELVNELNIMLIDKKISIDESVAEKVITKRLPDGKIAFSMSLGDILMKERKAYRWIKEGGVIKGKCQLIKKRDMRRIIGGSPDFMDGIKMKCYSNYKNARSNNAIRFIY